MRKILVVDDNPSFRELVEMIFVTDFEILGARDGLEGVNLATQHKPDLILMDVMMPKLTGTEMLRHLQANEDTRNIPIIVMSASRFDDSTKMMFQQEPNVYGFLAKPCGIDDLRVSIAEVLQRRYGEEYTPPPPQ